MHWVKARSSGEDGCVEVMLDAEGFHVRDSKERGDGQALTMTPSEWQRFCAVLLADDVRDAAVWVEHLRIVVASDGRFTVAVPGVAVLRYTAAERACFLDGLRNGEFGVPALAAALTPS